jgi:hypothetical protein
VVLLAVRSPPNIPEVKIPEDAAVNVALTLRYEINRGFATLREIGHGRDLKKFLIVCLLSPWTFLFPVSWYCADTLHLFFCLSQVIAGLWLLSVLGSCCNFLTLSYIGNDRVSYIPQISPFIVDASYEWKLFCSLCSLHGAVHCPSTV